MRVEYSTLSTTLRSTIITPGAALAPSSVLRVRPPRRCRPLGAAPRALPRYAARRAPPTALRRGGGHERGRVGPSSWPLLLHPDLFSRPLSDSTFTRRPSPVPRLSLRSRGSQSSAHGPAHPQDRCRPLGALPRASPRFVVQRTPPTASRPGRLPRTRPRSRSARTNRCAPPLGDGRRVHESPARSPPRRARGLAGPPRPG